MTAMFTQTLIIITYIHFCNGIKPVLNLEEANDAKLDFKALGLKYGHRVREHYVITEDGFILKLFNIPGDVRRPVLLVHGILDSADGFIIRGNTSLAITLANNGYDVWVYNSRGNRYSRAHRYLNPDGRKFWNFSFHEMGYYDLPAVIDYILGKTGQTQLSAIGHSLGNTLFYVLGSTRTEYNDKIKVMIALAPICFLNHVKPPISTLLASLPTIDSFLRFLNVEEVLNDNSAINKIFRLLCTKKEVNYELCADGLIFALGGRDPDEIEPEFLTVIISHYPTGTSRKNGVHLGQVALSKNFSHFDYGPEGNSALYNTSLPPQYDLGKVKMRIALFAGRNDYVSSVKDTEVLRDRLPNVIDYRVLKHKKFNHADFIWGRNINKYLFPHIFTVLNRFN